MTRNFAFQGRNGVTAQELIIAVLSLSGTLHSYSKMLKVETVIRSYSDHIVKESELIVLNLEPAVLRPIQQLIYQST